MATLDDLLGQQLIQTPRTRQKTPSGLSITELSDFFSTDALDGKLGDPGWNSQSGAMSQLMETAATDIELPRETRNALLDMAASGTWSLLDTATFGIAGWAMPDEWEEDYLLPQTGAGRFASAIGGTAGFIWGAPMKLGAKAAKAVASPIIKATGNKTLKSVINTSKTQVKEELKKRGITKYSTDAAEEIVNKTIGKRIGYESMKARWDKAGKAVADNWKTASGKAIDDIVGQARTQKQITSAEATVIRDVFKKNLSTRPMQDIVDVIMKKHPNTFGFVVGSMVHEAAMFGMIDAAMEGVHAARDGRAYDWSAPIWGVGIGSAFGALKFMAPKGKSSITSEDFMYGARALMSKGAFKNASIDELKSSAKIFGQSLKTAGEKTTVKFKDKTIDLLNPISSIGGSEKKAAEVLRELLISERRSYGAQMMKEAVKEDFKSSLANWKRILMGTAIMNTRHVLHMAQGHEVPTDELLTSILIGAFINRKGHPVSPEMNLPKMQQIRRGLNYLGVPQPRLFNMHPTLNQGENELHNPLSDRSYNQLREKARELGLVSNETKEVEIASQDGSPLLASSNKAFPLFDEAYIWIGGATGYTYKKPRALITEKQAAEFEKAIRTLEFEGVKINSVSQFRDSMISASDRINDKVAYEVKKTLHDVINGSVSDWTIKDPSKSDLGEIPNSIQINELLLRRIEDGKVLMGKDSGEVIDIDTALKSLRNVNDVLETVHRTRLGTMREHNGIVEIKSEDGLRNLIEKVNLGETRINRSFNNFNKNLKFEFDNLIDLETPLIFRQVNKGLERMGNFFGETDNPDFVKLKNALLDSNIAVQDSANRFKINLVNYNNITFAEGVDANSKAVIKNAIGILAAKSNRSIPPNTSTKTEIDVLEAQRFMNFLESNGINTNAEMMNSLQSNITMKLYSDVIAKSNVLNRDIGILGDLINLDVPMATYSPLVDGGTGFTVRKIKIKGTLNDYWKTQAEKYNRAIDHMSKRSENPETGQRFIQVESKEVETVDKEMVTALRSIMRRKGTKEAQRAAKTVIDFVQALQPTDTLAQGIRSFLERTNNPDKFLNFLLGKGLITTKKKRRAIDYYFDYDALNSKINRDMIDTWLNKHGVNTKDIEARMATAEVEINNFIDAKHSKVGSRMTQQGFFESYFPDLKRIPEPGGTVRTEPTGFGTRYSVLEQNTLIENALFDVRISNNNTIKTIKTGAAGDTVAENIIKEMDIKVGDRYVKGDVIIGRKNRYKNEYRRALNDTQKMLALRANSVEKVVLDIQAGGVKESVKIMQDTHYLKLLKDHDLPHVFVSGDIFLPMFVDGSVKSKRMNVFDFESPHHRTGFEKNADPMAISLRESFDKSMRAYEFQGTNGSHLGVELIRFGNAKDVLGLPSTEFAKVTEIFRKEIYDRYYKSSNDVQKNKLQDMMDALDASKSWGEIHTDAFRSVMVRDLVTGKGNDRFMDLAMGDSGPLANIGKRFSLYHTPSFKKLNSELMAQLARATLNKADADLLERTAHNDRGFIVWNDKDNAGIKSRVEKQLRDAGTSWSEMTNGRSDVSGFDSITYISKDFRRALELYYGSNQGSNVFKPIISSNGADQLMFAKTVFVYEPKMDGIFSKNKSLDMIITRTADKLESAIPKSDASKYPERPVYVDKTPVELQSISSAEINSHIKYIPNKNIGIGLIPHNRMNAKQSYSLTNYMNSGESKEYYDTFIKRSMENFAGTSSVSIEGIGQKFLQDPMYRRLALLKLKNIDPNTNLTALENSPDGLKNVSHVINWSLRGGDPLAFGDNIIKNALKSRYLDPLVSPISESSYGENYGAKSVLKQSIYERNLDPTIRTGQGENINIKHGEIMLPNHIREGSVSFKNMGMEFRAVNDKGSVVELKELMIDLKAEQIMAPGLKGGYIKTGPGAGRKPTKEEALEIAKKDIEKLFETDLGQIHDTLKDLSGEWSIGIQTTRYPRTAPNDMAILRLKGFLKKDEGNTVIANDFDVLNIFEGDYDVDEVDFFWASNKGTWNHIDRVKRHWVNSNNPDLYTPPSGDLQLMTLGRNNADWNKFDANNRTFKRGIGLVQKTIRLAAHVADLGVKNSVEGSETFGMKDLIEVKGADGKTYKLAVDYDNASWFQRTSLESQLIIDYWQGVNTKIANKMVDWRNDYLFPLKSNSISKEQVTSPYAKVQNQRKGPDTDKVRIFRKFEVGKGKDGEVDLTELDKTLIRSLMSEHSKLLTLSREVYDGSGSARPATYDQIISTAKPYFEKHLTDLTSTIFNAARRKHGNHEDFESYFSPFMTLRSGSRKKLGYYYGDKLKDFQSEVDADFKRQEVQSKHHYKWWKKSPLLPGVLQQGKDIATPDGTRGSVYERIYRIISDRDPLNTDGRKGKVDIIPQGDLYKELESANALILSEYTNFGSNPREVMIDILPGLTKNINKDINIIKSYKRIEENLVNDRNLPIKLKEARLEGIRKVIEEKQLLLRDYISPKFKETGDPKYLEKLKMVDIKRDKDYMEATIQLYTLFEHYNKFRPKDDLGFDQAVLDAKGFTSKAYSEFYTMGESSGYGPVSMPRGLGRELRETPFGEVRDVEAKITESLEAGFQKYNMPFLFHYAMPGEAKSSIGVFNGTPIAMSTKSSGRMKRVIRFLMDKTQDKTLTREERNEVSEVLDQLAQRYTAYKNFFNERTDLIPFRDQDFLSIINNVPGLNKNLATTFDRYESVKIEKGILSKDVFGMGPEYDTNISFYRRLINDAFGKNENLALKELEATLSYTNQLLMENNYLNPISYFMMTESVRNKLSAMGLDTASTHTLQGTEEIRLSPHDLSPDLAMLAGRGGGASIKPLGMLNDYRMNLLRRFIKQGKDIKLSQRNSGESIRELKERLETGGRCKPLAR